MSSIIPKVGKIVIGGLKTTPRLTLSGTPDFGKASAYLNKTNPQKNMISPGTLRKYSERRFNIEPYYTIPGDPYAADVGKRQIRTVFRPITKPSSSDNFEGRYKINIGENISVSKDVLREFQAREGGAGVGGAFRIGGLNPGTSVGAGRVPITNKNIKMGLDYLYKNLGGVAGVMGNPPQTPGGGGGSGGEHGLRQPGTGGPNRGGRGPRQPGTGGSGGSGGRPIRDAIELFGSFYRMLKSLAHILGLGALGTGFAWLLGAGGRVVEKANEETDKIIDNAFFLSKGAKETLKKNKAILLAFLVLAGGSAELLRRSMPKIKRVLSNRRIAVEIEKALDAGDEDLARTILFDAVEDEGINLSGLRRRLSPSDYQRLYRDT